MIRKPRFVCSFCYGYSKVKHECDCGKKWCSNFCAKKEKFAKVRQECEICEDKSNCWDCESEVISMSCNYCRDRKAGLQNGN